MPRGSSSSSLINIFVSADETLVVARFARRSSPLIGDATNIGVWWNEFTFLTPYVFLR
jgi:hypothetical protein